MICVAMGMALAISSIFSIPLQKFTTLTTIFLMAFPIAIPSSTRFNARKNLTAAVQTILKKLVAVSKGASAPESVEGALRDLASLLRASELQGNSTLQASTSSIPEAITVMADDYIPGQPRPELPRPTSPSESILGSHAAVGEVDADVE